MYVEFNVGSKVTVILTTLSILKYTKSSLYMSR